MALIMLGIRWKMVPRTVFTIGLAIAFVVLFPGFWSMSRAEIVVGNEKFLRAMIPHHSQAMLVCNTPSIADVEIEHRCTPVVAAQEEAIATMEAMLAERQTGPMPASLPLPITN